MLLVQSVLAARTYSFARRTAFSPLRRTASEPSLIRRSSDEVAHRSAAEGAWLGLALVWAGPLVYPPRVPLKSWAILSLVPAVYSEFCRLASECMVVSPFFSCSQSNHPQQ